MCSTSPCCANSSSRLECNLFTQTCFHRLSMGMQMSLFRGSWPHARALQCPPSAQRRTHYFSWFLCDSPPGLYITVQRSSQPHILVQILQIGQVVADAFVIGRQYFSQLSFSVNSDPWGWSSQDMSKTTRPLWAVVARACAVSKAALPWPKIITAFPSKGSPGEELRGWLTAETLMTLMTAESDRELVWTVWTCATVSTWS